MNIINLDDGGETMDEKVVPYSVGEEVHYGTNIGHIEYIQEQKERGRYFEMHLKDEPYTKILSGLKIYELRLYDEKRKNLKEGDVIRFDRLSSDDKDKCFYTKVKRLKRYDSFSLLYDASKTKEDPISMYRCGSPKNITKKSFLKRMETYYPLEKQKEHGVVAIQLEVIYSPETENNIKSALCRANQRRPMTYSLDFNTWNSFSEEYFKAICLAEVAHRNVLRKMSDIDFICHPVEVASIVHDILYRGEFPVIQIYNRAIAAAALHDVVEDTSYTLEDIDEVFGESICELVAEETENKRRTDRPEDTWRIRKAEFLEKLSKASDFARAITLADKLSNMRDMRVDYKELGEELWKKFNNNNKEDHAWYYKSVVEELGKPNKERDYIVGIEISETEEYKELKRLVSEIFD